MSELQFSNGMISNTSIDFQKKIGVSENISTEPRGIPNIKTKYSRFLNREVSKILNRKPENIGSIFDSKKFNLKKRKKKLNKSFFPEFYARKKNRKEVDDYNVFWNEDNIVKDLMLKFKDTTEKDKIPKIKRRRMAFNRLYDLTKESKDKIINVKKTKYFYPLGEYQENIIKALDPNIIEKNEILNLIKTFKDLKIDSSEVKILPRINVNVIRDHVLNNKKKEFRKKTVKEIINSSKQPLDEFEKEEKIFKSTKGHKSQPKIRKNQNLDPMPDYIKEIFTKKINFH